MFSFFLFLYSILSWIPCIIFKQLKNAEQKYFINLPTFIITYAGFLNLSYPYNCAFYQIITQIQYKIKTNKNKSITMMRGKSPRSNVEITKKTKFRGGHLGFLTGISQSILTKLGTHI